MHSVSDRVEGEGVGVYECCEIRSTLCGLGTNRLSGVEGGMCIGEVVFSQEQGGGGRFRGAG